MREIKFRGKRVDNGEWVCGDLTGGDTIHTSPSTYSDFGETQWWGQEVSPETVGQYTALKDKNGKEIYEGDIITYEAYDGNNEYTFKGVACFSHDGFCIEKLSGSPKINNGEKLAFGSFDKGKGHLIKEEVIGNIHDQPEGNVMP